MEELMVIVREINYKSNYSIQYINQDKLFLKISSKYVLLIVIFMTFFDMCELILLGVLM